MDSEASGPAEEQQSRHEQVTSTQPKSRSRQASLSPVQSIELADAPTHTVTSERPSKQPRLRHGSSRDQPQMQMSTPPEVAGPSVVKYTRTGRVSRATKGQPVHHCTECDKTYTRAEHLRRHQKNHRPGAYPCDWPGCDRSFHRDDLLARHRARHIDPHNPPSRRQSIGSINSAPDAGEGFPSAPSALAPILPPAHTILGAPATITSRQPSTTNNTRSPNASRPPKRPIAPNELSHGSAMLLVPDCSGDTSYLRQAAISPSPQVSPRFGYDSTPSFEDDDIASHRCGSSRWSIPYVPHSPASSGSPMIDPFWTPASHPTPVIYGAHGEYNLFPQETFHHDFQRTQLSHESYCLMERRLSIGARDVMEMQQLFLPGTDLDFNPCGSAAVLQQTYEAAYWSTIHRVFPVIHREAYVTTASPLLRAALLALGAHSVGGRNDLSNARILHERCVKVLRKRTDDETHTTRVCDLQAILLVEVFSVFKSRRPPLQLSRSFDIAYNALVDEGAVNDMANASMLDQYGNIVEDSLAIQCKHRLALACHLLDTQHAMLFARPPHVNTTPLLASMPMPCPQAIWDLSINDCVAFQSQALARNETFGDMIEGASALSYPIQQPFDTFRSSLLIASIWSFTGDLNTIGATYNERQRSTPSVLFALEQSPRSALSYHTAMLCKHVPVLRELLAVAGESWIMTEKLKSQAEFASAQRAVRKWASGRTDRVTIATALSHAFAILSTQRSTPQSGLLYQEWAVYLAALVIWARVYAIMHDDQRPRASMSVNSESRSTLHELDSTMTMLLQGGPKLLTSWTDAQMVLQWVKSRIEGTDVPHTCGLSSGALDVLGKLITRGNDPLWF